MAWSKGTELRSKSELQATLLAAATATRTTPTTRSTVARFAGGMSTVDCRTTEITAVPLAAGVPVPDSVDHPGGAGDR